MANVSIGKGIDKQQKKTIYILFVMLFLASLFVLLYLLFILINTNDPMIVLSAKTTKVVGGILVIMGAIFGRPLGKKWWQIVYEEKHRGLVLKVKK